MRDAVGYDLDQDFVVTDFRAQRYQTQIIRSMQTYSHLLWQ